VDVSEVDWRRTPGRRNQVTRTNKVGFGFTSVVTVTLRQQDIHLKCSSTVETIFRVRLKNTEYTNWQRAANVVLESCRTGRNYLMQRPARHRFGTSDPPKSGLVVWVRCTGSWHC
jgi:hypothetical protein